jgi:hypothetical protein
MNAPSDLKKWNRAQKFRLSERGTEAGERYRAMIVAARATEGRDAFDAARSAWALAMSLDPGDGAFLGELLDGSLTIDQLARALDACGTTREETRAAVDRLAKSGFLEPLPLVEAAPRWR